MASEARTWLAHPADKHCVLFHLGTVGAYGLAFWLWLHPAAAGITGPGSRVTLLRARWDLAQGLPERWPAEARAAMSAVLREQAVGLGGARLVDEALGVQGPTAMPVEVEPGACYLALVVELRGIAQTLSLAARAGGRDAQCRAPLDARGTALSFCAASTSRAILEVEARGLSLVWMSALWQVGKSRLGEMER